MHLIVTDAFPAFASACGSPKRLPCGTQAFTNAGQGKRLVGPHVHGDAITDPAEMASEHAGRVVRIARDMPVEPAPDAIKE